MTDADPRWGLDLNSAGLRGSKIPSAALAFNQAPLPHEKCSHRRQHP